MTSSKRETLFLSITLGRAELGIITKLLLPKGFEVIKEVEEEEYLLITYKNNLEYIKYHCFEINNNRLYIDTENATVTEVLIEGIKADYIDKGAFQMISWEKDGYGYNLSVESIDENYIKFDKEELIKIAESIK